MHSATTATGRPLPPPGKSLPRNRPAPLSCRATHQLAAPKPHVTYVTSHRQCYIPAPASTSHSALIASHYKINRQPRRLEFTLSRTKQTPAPQINRQQITTSKISISNRHNQEFAQTPTRHSSLATRHRRSNRHTPRLENAISHRKQTLGASSNRHFLQVSASLQLTTANAHHPTHNVSNRQRQILEINVNLSKQTIAPRSNQHKNAFIKCQKSHVTTARHDSTIERQPQAQQTARCLAVPGEGAPDFRPSHSSVSSLDSYISSYIRLVVTSPGSETRIRWLGDSQKVIRGFSEAARQNLGNDLQRLDEGEEPLDFAAMGAVLPGVFELRERDLEHWYRVLYIPLEGLIYVLHCFTKTTNQTPQKEIETAGKRLQLLRQGIARRKKEAKHEG
jgi:phage-related protein